MANYNIGNLTSRVTSRNRYSVTPGDPTDVFKFNVRGRTNINLNLHNISSGDDADLRLYEDSNGNGVLDSSDRWIASSSFSRNHDDSINFQVYGGSSGRNYFAQVRRYSPGSSGSVSYDLDLSATGFTSPSNLLPRETEVGNLSRDRTYSNAVGNRDTSDVYAFSLGLYEGVNISLSGLSNDADIRLIRDRNNNRIVDAGEVVGSSTNRDDLSEFISEDLSGNYFLQVYQSRGDTNYNLTFDHYTTPYA